jgi:hypothetical protein
MLYRRVEDCGPRGGYSKVNMVQLEFTTDEEDCSKVAAFLKSLVVGVHLHRVSQASKSSVLKELLCSHGRILGFTVPHTI